MENVVYNKNGNYLQILKKPTW